MKTPLISALILPIFSMFFGVQGQAAIEGSVNNATVSGYDDSVKTNIILFAGMTDGLGECAASLSTTNVCNSCTGLTDLSNPANPSRCTFRSIHKDLLLNIYFKVDVVPTNSRVLVQLTVGTSTVAITDIVNSISNSTPAANETVSVQIEWSKICSRADLGTDCKSPTGANTGFEATLSAGVTAEGSTTTFASGAEQKFTIRYTYASSTGALLTTCGASDPFCSFEVTPGDSKVYLKKADRGKLGPDDGSGIKYSAMRVYSAQYTTSPPDFRLIPLGSGAQFTDLPVQSKTEIESEFQSKTAGGLENEKNYMFAIATVDEATVVDGFIDPTLLVEGVHTARPGQVVGLLDSKSCFIATAAYGSEMAPQVENLRKFRNQVLLPSVLGRKFVALYYEISPPIAQFIAGHEWLRAFTRLLLLPLIFFADLSSWLGFIPALLLVLVGFFALIFGIHRFRQRIGEA